LLALRRQEAQQEAHEAGGHGKDLR
jgi:hypothetical protein